MRNAIDIKPNCVNYHYDMALMLIAQSNNSNMNNDYIYNQITESFVSYVPSSLTKMQYNRSNLYGQIKVQIEIQNHQINQSIDHLDVIKWIKTNNIKYKDAWLEFAQKWRKIIF